MCFLTRGSSQKRGCVESLLWNPGCGILAGRHLAAGDLKAAWEAKKLIFYCVLQHFRNDPQFRSRVAHLGVTVYCYLQHFSANADDARSPHTLHRLLKSRKNPSVQALFREEIKLNYHWPAWLCNSNNDNRTRSVEK